MNEKCQSCKHWYTGFAGQDDYCVLSMDELEAETGKECESYQKYGSEKINKENKNEYS